MTLVFALKLSMLYGVVQSVYLVTLLRAMAKEGGQAIQRKQGRATHTGAYNENRGVQPKTREHKQGRTTQTGAYSAKQKSHMYVV